MVVQMVSTLHIGLVLFHHIKQIKPREQVLFYLSTFHVYLSSFHMGYYAFSTRNFLEHISAWCSGVLNASYNSDIKPDHVKSPDLDWAFDI